MWRRDLRSGNDHDGNGVTTRLPFPGNIIPASRIDPAMIAYAKVFLPAPNTDVNGNNYINTQSERVERKSRYDPSRSTIRQQ